MDLLVNRFKREIAAGRPQIGLWGSFATHHTVEVVSQSGFDWLLVDVEHRPTMSARCTRNWSPQPVALPYQSCVTVE